MDYDLEMDKVVNFIKKQKAKLVCIQLPDGLKPNAMGIADEIKKKTKAEVIIWADSCFGGCDTPIEIQHLGVDLVVQWGHSRTVMS